MPVSYAESESSLSPSPYKTSKRGFGTLDAEDDSDENIENVAMLEAREEEEDIIEYSTPSQRKAGLRARQKNMSLKAQENVSLDRK